MPRNAFWLAANVTGALIAVDLFTLIADFTIQAVLINSFK